MRDVHHDGAVVAGPGHEHRRLVAGDEPLVGVDPLVGHRRDLAGVGEQAGDEAPGHRREVVRVAGVVEGVAVALEEGEVGVHPRSLDCGEGFRHEGGVGVGLLRQFLHDVADRHDGVRHAEGVGVAEVDLVLAGRILVPAVLDRDAHVLQGQHRGLPQVGGLVGHGELEVRPMVEGLQRGRGLPGRQVEELDLGGRVEVEAPIPGTLEGPSQHVARAALKGTPVEVEDVADDPGHRRFAVGVPGQELERLGVRPCQDVAFLHAAESVDRRAIERDALRQGLLELAGGDVEAARDPEDIGEPELDDPHRPVLDDPQHVVLPLLHRASLAEGAGG